MAENPAELPRRKWIEPVVDFVVALFAFAVIRMLLMPAA
jgi:hypothetical protein